MEEENRFDELLKSKLSERDFPFDEMNWDEAEKQIIKQENRRKTTRFGLIFVSGLLAGIIIMLPFMVKNKNTLFTSITSSGSSEPGSQHIASLNPSSESQRGTASLSTSKQNQYPAQTENGTWKGENHNNSQFSISNSGEHQPISASGLGQVKTHEGALNSVNSSVQSPAPNPKIGDKGGELASNNDSHDKKQHTLSGGNHKVVNTPGLVYQTLKGKGTFNSVNSSVQSPAPNPKIGDKEGELASNNATDNNNQVVSENLQPLQPITVTIEQSPFNPKIYSGYLSGFWYFNEVDSVNPNPASVLPKDSDRPEFAMLRVKWSGHVGSEYKPLNSIFIDAGVNCSLGWNNGDEKEARGITPILGISFHHYFNDKLFGSIGIQPQILNGLNKTYNASVVTQFDFGENEIVTTITPKTLYYIGLPVKLGLNLDNKDILIFGVNLLYLLNTSSNETSYNQTYFGTTNYSSITKTGYTQGFNATDIQISFGFTRMFTSHLGFSIEYYYGLQPVENSEFFMSNQTDKNSGLRAVVLYRIVK